MKQIFDQLLAFLQQGIAAIFQFIELIWTWSVDQITRVFQAPWDSWPITKQVLVVLILAAVAFAVYRAAIQLWVAGIGVLRAFASLLVAFVMTLPAMVVAGAIALGGLWVINNLNLSQWPTFTSIFSDSDSRDPADTVGRGNRPDPEVPAPRAPTPEEQR